MTDQENRQEDKAYMHWLYQAVGMGNSRFLQEMDKLGSPRMLYELVRMGKLEEKLSKQYQKKAIQIAQFTQGYDVVGEYEKMRERGIRFLTIQDKEYPTKMAEISDPPYGIYYIGRMPEEDRKSVAIIGARECSEYGRHMAKLFGKELAEAGIQVISGMARGIDGISQHAALAADGYSLGVLGCGVDICYPAENRRLYEELAVQGGICSEYPPGIEPRAVLFPRRNRIISAMCDAVLVIEARQRSGTLITVDMALEQGREVYALPGRATDLLSDGCNRLIKQGAGMVTSPQELMEELAGVSQEGRNYWQQEFFGPEGMQGELMQILDYQPQSVQTIQGIYEARFERHLTMPELMHELLQMCINGYAKQISGSYFTRNGE